MKCLDRVAKTFRIFFILLKTLARFWSSRDHHLKVTYFNNPSANSQYHERFRSLLLAFTQFIRSIQRHTQTLTDIHRFRIRFEFSPPPGANHNNTLVLSEFGLSRLAVGFLVLG